MTYRKNGFLNFCFSLLPGAGQMYQGFMKRGVSIMTLFFGWLCVSTVFSVEELLFFIPVIWFFGFFDSLHSNSLSDEARVQRKDAFLFVEEGQLDRLAFRKLRIPAAVVLILFGGYSILCGGIRFLIERSYLYWDSGITKLVYDYLPNMVFSVVIILLGVYLIVGKKKEISERDDAMFYEEPAKTDYDSRKNNTEESEGGEA
jgi:hypothetical protein